MPQQISAVSAIERPKQQCPSGNGQRPQTVEEAALGILGDTDGAAREQAADGGERRDEEVDVLDVAGLDRAAEHVAEDQQEHRRGQRLHHEQLRRAHELLDRAPGVGVGRRQRVGGWAGGVIVRVIRRLR